MQSLASSGVVEGLLEHSVESTNELQVNLLHALERVSHAQGEIDLFKTTEELTSSLKNVHTSEISGLLKQLADCRTTRKDLKTRIWKMRSQVLAELNLENQVVLDELEGVHQQFADIRKRSAILEAQSSMYEEIPAKTTQEGTLVASTEAMAPMEENATAITSLLSNQRLFEAITTLPSEKAVEQFLAAQSYEKGPTDEEFFKSTAREIRQLVLSELSERRAHN